MSGSGRGLGSVTGAMLAKRCVRGIGMYKEVKSGRRKAGYS
jgi:hypothetical protein